MIRLMRDDRGQITTALVLVGTVLVVAFGAYVTKLGQATDQVSHVQTAADAAALAAAQQIRNDVPALLLAAVLGGDTTPFNCGLGAGAASDFANRSGAQVVQYCYYAESDTVQVSVAGLSDSVSGSPAKAKAESRVGLGLGPCVVPEAPTPASAPPSPPSPAPTTPPPPPPDVSGEVRCGDLRVPVVIAGVSGVIRIGLSDSEIRDLFTPALKS